MTAPLEDRRLEAAANIFLLGSIYSDVKYARRFISEHQDKAPSIISTAIRETHAAELAEALEEAVRQIEYLHEKFGQTGSGNGVIARCSHVLAKFQEIANDQPKHRS